MTFVLETRHTFGSNITQSRTELTNTNRRAAELIADSRGMVIVDSYPDKLVPEWHAPKFGR